MTNKKGDCPSLKIKILDLGCGFKKIGGAIGIDLSPKSGADIIWDLNQFPWPISDNEFGIVVCNHILEHLENVVKAMEEIHRICKSGGIIRIEIPHFSSCHAFRDITHRHYFGYESFDGLCGFEPWFYTKIKFKLRKRELVFWKLHRIDGIEFLANKFPIFYEKYFAFIFPARCLQFELEVIK